jgi:two-component system catabolic regulation response regulator CreB
MTRCDVRCTTLLLLEDDPAIASLVSYALTRDGFVVDHVNLVQHAQLRLDDPARTYAAAILDVGLPDGNGLDLCRALRLRGHRWAALPILMLTARSEELDRVLGLELGADDYVSKPFSPRELVARVRALLRRASLPPTPPAMPHAAVTHGPSLVCDATTQRATFGGQPLPLTRREWGLLATLLQSPGRIWSREALLDAVWGHAADSTDRTVDTHIKTLRAKLREAGCPDELIGTHRGMGYAIDPAKLAG